MTFLSGVLSLKHQILSWPTSWLYVSHRLEEWKCELQLVLHAGNLPSQCLLRVSSAQWEGTWRPLRVWKAYCLMTLVIKLFSRWTFLCHVRAVAHPSAITDRRHCMTEGGTSTWMKTRTERACPTTVMVKGITPENLLDYTSFKKFCFYEILRNLSCFVTEMLIPHSQRCLCGQARFWLSRSGWWSCSWCVFSWRCPCWSASPCSTSNSSNGSTWSKDNQQWMQKHPRTLLLLPRRNQQSGAILSSDSTPCSTNSEGPYCCSMYLSIRDRCCKDILYQSLST